MMLAFTGGLQAKLTIPVVKKVPKGTLGVKIGANFEQITRNETWEKAYKPGVLFGVFGGVHKNNWGVKAEVLLNTSQYTLKDSLNKGTFRAVTLAVPILAEYKVWPRIWVQAGPQFNSIMSVKSSNDAFSDPKKYFNTSSVNLVAGVEAHLPLHIIAGARYVLGLTDLQNQSVGVAKEAWKQRSIQAYLGFRFI